MHACIRALVAAQLCASAFLVEATPMTYRIDPTHSFVLLGRSNYGFSHPFIVAAVDRGTVVFDREEPSKSSVQVSLPVARINTFVAQLDKEFQSPMFFDAGRFPTITFQSTRVQPAGPAGYTITGNLTAHGITRPVVLHARLNKDGRNPMTGKQAIGFDATGTLKRSDFGLGFNAPDVSDELTLTVTMQADAMK